MPSLGLADRGFVRPEPTYGGLTAACVVALVIPFGLTFAVEGMRWRHEAGVNWTLVTVLAAAALIGSMLIGLLASEVGRQRSLVRGVAAAGLAGVTSVLLALVIDSHPGKFGFDLGGSAYVVLAAPVIAFLFASRLLARR